MVWWQQVSCEEREEGLFLTFFFLKKKNLWEGFGLKIPVQLKFKRLAKPSPFCLECAKLWCVVAKVLREGDGMGEGASMLPDCQDFHQKVILVTNVPGTNRSHL